MKKRRGAAEREGDQREGRPENIEIIAGHMKSRRVRGEKDKGKKGERVAVISRGRVLVGGGGGEGACCDNLSLRATLPDEQTWAKSFSNMAAC
jgi:hypothetical protein